MYQLKEIAKKVCNSIIKSIKSASKWNDKFDLSDGSYSVSDIRDYFEYIFKKNGDNIDNFLTEKYVNKIENRITFKITTGYYLEFWTLETTKLLRNTGDKITKDK